MDSGILEALSAASKVGKLTQEQREHAAKLLGEKCGVSEGKIPTCSMCQKPDAEWGIAEHLVAPIVIANGGFQFVGPVYPYLALSCTVCGNTHFFNAMKLGIVKHRPNGSLALYDEQEIKSGN